MIGIGRKLLDTRIAIPVLLITGVLASIVSLYLSVSTVRDVTRPVREAITSATAPAELTSATFVALADDSTTFYVRDSASGSFTQSTVKGHVISQDRNGEYTAQIVVASGAQYAVTVNGAIVATSTYPLTGVTVSGDGAHIMFAQAKDTQSFTLPRAAFVPILTIAPRDWSVVYLNRQTGRTQVVSEGVSPYFVDSRHSIYVAATGIYMYDLNTATSTVVLAQSISRTPVLRLVSPDRLKVALFDLKARALAVYAIDPTERKAQDLGITTLAGTVAAYTLGNDGVYVLKLPDQKSEVWKQTFGSSVGSLAFVLPAGIKTAWFTFGAY